MKLSSSIAYIARFDPDLLDPEIEQYCLQSDALKVSPHGGDLEGAFHYGYKSLKWAMYQIEEIDPKRFKHVFKAIMIEHKARQKSILDIQYNILNYAAMAEYKQIIRARTKDTVDLETLGHFTAGNYIFAINDTAENLTARIMRDTNADAILFRNPETRAVGIIFRTGLYVPSMLRATDLFQHISATEPGWKLVGASLINHGAPSGTATTHTIQSLQQIIEAYFNI